MTTKPTSRFARLSLVSLVLAGRLLIAAPGSATGPLAVCNPGQPFLWPGGGANIPYNPDQGPLGPLTNAQAVTLVGNGFGQWDAIPSATTTYLNAGPLPVDVDITNFGPYLEPVAPDGLSAIVFDDTGEIFDLLFGPGSGILGFAGPEWVNTLSCTILEGVAFLNGPAFGDATEALDVITHEFGHYQNLAHTVVNGQILLGDNSGPTPNDTFPIPSLAGKVETMYPFYFGTAAGTSSPEKDDISGLSALYPAATFASTTATITGKILGPNGTTPLTGVNVIARNTANPFVDAVSAISSDYAVDYSTSAPFVGVYTIKGLTPGAQYAVYVDEILAGGFSTPPLNPLPGPEEFRNTAESSNGATDNPTVFNAVSAAAGATASNINIIFNAPVAGQPLPVGDDGSVQLFLPFAFEICGQRFDSLFVNANGNLTFGAPSADFSESIVEFLSGPPRIAGLWDDLNAGAGGTVVFGQTSSTFTVTYTNVPEFSNTGANTFSIKLQKSSNHVDITYGSLTAADGLAGVSCGGAVTSGFEPVTDLSHENGTQDLKKQPAIFELFGPGNPVDLSGRTQKFNAKASFDDDFESNDTVNQAEHIHLPFDSVDEKKDFTEIRPAGDDVDFYDFSVKAGDILAVEVVRGNLDTVIGIFDADTGTLLAADDDGGDGLLSRLLVQADEDLDLAVAVSTFPDLDFTGAGEGAGRYVLSVHKYRGTILAAGDDTATPVSLGFNFPFQGATWSSVFVNSNGNLTFGAGNTDFSETVPEFLAGPPRIAPRWTDLDANGGLVIAEQDDDDEITFHFVSVPEFFSTSPNYFSVKLDDHGEIDLDYFATTRTDGLTGITKGGGVADPGEDDLSDDDDWPRNGTTYELFSTSDVFSFDLFYSELEFD
ncbi:MAG: hypothetical protein ABUT39_07870 [Acidobacteriota bacterium]